MRAILKISVLSLLLAGFLGTVSSALAQPFVIFGYTNQVWKFETNSQDAIPTWKDVGFDDSAWGSGRGSLGNESGATLTTLDAAGATLNTTIAIASSGNRYAAYFRTHFNLGVAPANITLTFSNRVDDGAVIYLNGVEVTRLGIAASVSPVVYTTLATSTESTLQIFSTNHPSLVAGDNVLAVEVHQTGNTSSDIVMAMALNGAASAPPVINYPASSLTNRTLAQCVGSTTLSVVASGSPAPTYQWTHAGTNLPGATAATYAINNVALGAAGNYTVILSNANGMVTSTPATVVSVTPDTTAPVVLYATSSTNLTNVTVVFSETIDLLTPSLGDMASNMELRDTNTDSVVTILNVTGLAGGNGYLLQTDPIDPTHGYSLYVSATLDACVNNPLDTVTVPVYSFHSVPLPLNATWRYLDNDIDPAANWPQNAFNDSGWLSGNGPFDSKRNAGGQDTNCRPGGVMTNYFTDGTFTVPYTCILLTSPVSLTNLVTAYFRAHFTYSGDTNATLLELSGKFDDGGVVYLNGTELVRYGMAASPPAVTDTTFATRTGGDADREDVSLFLVPASLRSGDNVIAVDVHQANITSSDMTMGLTVQARTLVPLATAARLTITESGGNVTVTWAGGGTLQSSMDISNPANWTNVGGSPTSPYTTAHSAAAKFYRVTNP